MANPITVKIDAKAVVLLFEIVQLAESIKEDLYWRCEPSEISEKAQEIARNYIHVNTRK